MPSQKSFVFIFIICYLIYRVECDFSSEGSDDDLIDLSGYDLRFGQPDMKTGDVVKQWQPSDNTNPEELGNYMEGDILFPRNRSTNSRNGLVGQSYRWSNGVIPYEIQGNFDSRSLNLIQNAMGVYHKETCLKFQRRTAKDRDYISIQNAQSGCWSSIGRVGGPQTVTDR